MATISCTPIRMLHAAVFPWLLFAAIHIAPAQQSGARPLPAAQPTQQAAAAQPAPQPLEAKPQAFRARVEFSGGKLAVSAENSSLNQILSDIAKATGMKITGGVADERVYGTYGPDTQQAVLSALLEGTGTNIMLVENAQHGVQELMLTPRTGGPTPPSPAVSFGADRNDAEMPQPNAGSRRGWRETGGRTGGNFEQRRPLETPSQPPTPPVLPPEQQPNGTAEASPNGVKTPEEIYNELIRAGQAPQTPPATTPPH